MRCVRPCGCCRTSFQLPRQLLCPACRHPACGTATQAGPVAPCQCRGTASGGGWGPAAGALGAVPPSDGSEQRHGLGACACCSASRSHGCCSALRASFRSAEQQRACCAPAAGQLASTAAGRWQPGRQHPAPAADRSAPVTSLQIWRPAQPAARAGVCMPRMRVPRWPGVGCAGQGSSPGGVAVPIGSGLHRRHAHASRRSCAGSWAGFGPSGSSRLRLLRPDSRRTGQLHAFKLAAGPCPPPPPSQPSRPPPPGGPPAPCTFTGIRPQPE